jgi:predicted ATP-binding protein involved in virulence
MHLENYRCFENFAINFDEHLTVLVGVNGSGKTAVLDALSILLKNIHQYKYITRERISDNDVNLNKINEDIICEYSVQFSKNLDNTRKKIKIIFERLKRNSSILILNENMHTPDEINSIRKFFTQDMPVCAAYMAGRFLHEQATVLKRSSNMPSGTSAFDNAFSRSIEDYQTTLSWFNNMDADEARAMRDHAQKIEMPELKAVREALSKALLGQYERPRMKGSPPELIIYKKGTDTSYKVSQLSDGYRAMLAVVMDLARRMALVHNAATSSDESVLHSPAIVLIDEVDLHLHPSWQQTVLPTLMEIFPNTQFVVTTHSPQVLTSIPPKHIRILSDGNVYSVDEQTEGAESSRLLKHVLGVDPRPQDLLIVKKLEEYAKLVYDEKWNTQEAQELYDTLIKHFKRDDQKLAELEMHVENSKWERAL